MRRLVAATLLLLAACADPGAVRKGADGQPLPPKYGVVDAVKPIDLPVEQGGSGGFFGGTMGNVGGAVLGGSGRGAAVGSVLGGVAGARAGDSAQNSRIRPGLEIWVTLDSGRSAVVTQPAKTDEPFKVGERVRIVHTMRGQRVEHEPSGQ
jgi:outer membrane lipoprotein SlyB